MTDNYKDIIDLPYPRDDWNFLMKHPRMSIANRAKIFSPFAALRGHNEKIAETAEQHLDASRDENMWEDVDGILSSSWTKWRIQSFFSITRYYWIDALRPRLRLRKHRKTNEAVKFIWLFLSSRCDAKRQIGLQATCFIRLALVSSGQAPQNDVKRQMRLIMNRL